MPILYNEISGGRVLTCFFFIALVLAGLSSMVANIELFVHNVGDFGGKGNGEEGTYIHRRSTQVYCMNMYE